MATISELNIRLGLLTKEFDSNLKQVEGKLRASGRRLSALGTDLTYAISLPLAAFGASAIQAAGDAEALRLAMRATFEGAGRSIQAADAELANLRKSALAPGLDFEQAVRGSVRLQNVGFSAETARGVIEQLANTIATTGGTAQDLDEVVNQFSQMIGKGKIFQDDLKIITGRMPKLAQLMKDTFGTTTAEGLNALGIDAKTFVDTMTREMGKLPRVTGGINNAIVNAGSALKQFLAGIGEEINKVFKVGDLSDRFANSLEDILGWFKALDDGTKKLLIEFGLFAVAFGPMVKVLGFYKTAVADTISVGRALAKGVASMASGVLEAAKAFQALSLATQTFIVLGVAIAVYAAYQAFAAYTRELTTAEKITKSISDVNQKAARDIRDQQTGVELLTNVLKDNNATQEDRRKALAELKRISPQYFGALDLEKSKVGDIDTALKGYIGSLLKAATAQAAFEKIKANAGKRLDLQEAKKAPSSIADRFSAGPFVRGEQAVIAVRNKGIEAEIAALDAEDAAMTKHIEVNGGLVAAVKNSTDVTKKNTEAVNKNEDAVKAAANAEKDFWDEMESIVDSGQEASTQLDKATASYIKMKDTMEGGINTPLTTLPQVQPLAPKLPELKSELGSAFTITLDADPTKANAAIQALKDHIAEIGTASGSASKSISDGIAKGAQGLSEIFDSKQFTETYAAAATLADGLVGLQQNRATQEKAILDQEYAAKFAAAKDNAALTAQLQEELAAKKAAIDKKVGAQSKATAITTALINVAVGVSKALSSAAPPFNFILAGLTAAAGAVQIAAIRAQKFAKGGVVRKPTYGLVGEYPGAASNPEIIAPQNMIREIFRTELQTIRERVTTRDRIAMPKLAGGGVLTKPTYFMGGEYPGASSNPEIVAPQNMLREIFRTELQTIRERFTTVHNAVPKLAGGGVLSMPTMFLGGEYPGASSNPEIVTPQSMLRGLFRDELQGLIARLAPPRLAGGGVLKKSTFFLGGEYSGASSNPEIVAPQNMLRGIFRQVLDQAPVAVYGVIRGSDILLSSERAANDRTRIR